MKSSLLSILTIIFTIVAILGIVFVVAKNTPDVTPHTCESVCPECGKCTDDACTEDACKDKCAGHTAPPTHECESVCPECGKCTDKDCTEDACKDKCAGHTAPPAHKCESVCPECGKCTDKDCTEDACKDKCAGHAVLPPHTCESVCDECGKCTDLACDETACADKCDGHESDVETEFVYDKFELNLMSFNIRTMATETNPVNNWSSRKDAVVAFVNSCGADIIGMQEVKKQQYEYISARLASNYTMLNFPRQGGDNPEGLAFVYDSTKFEFISSEKYWLSETPDEQSYGWGESYYRIAVVLVLRHIESGEIVKAINTHGPLNDEANVKAYELIMERSVKEGDPFTFLCGDFNAQPDQIGYVPVAAELQDCRVSALESSSRNDSTFTGWGSYVPGETPGTQIDFCFVSKGDNVKVLTYEVRFDRWGENNENWLSDHFPVQTTVEVTYKTNLPANSGGGFDGEIDPA